MKCLSRVLGALVLLLAVPASAASLSFDFGGGAAGNVNNVDATDGIQGVDNAIDTTGVATYTDLDITSATGFSSVANTSGTATPGAPANTYFADDQTNDNFFGFTQVFSGAQPLPSVTYLISGLTANSSYDFTFFGSRMGPSDNRETEYNVDGTSVFLNTTGNTDNVVQIAGALANASGELSLTVDPGPNNNNGFGFYYLGAMQIDGDFQVVPEPASLALLAAGGIALMVRRRS